MKNNSIRRGISNSKIPSKPVVNNTIHKPEEILHNNKERDSVQIKDQSPLLYNRKKDTKFEISTNTINDNKTNISKNPKAKVNENEIKSGTERPIQYLESKSDKHIENESLRKRVNELEKELNSYKIKLKEKENLLLDRERKLLEIEIKYQQIKSHVKKKRSNMDENEELAFALERIHQMESGGNIDNSNSLINNHPFSLINSMPLVMDRQLANRMLILNDIMVPLEQQYVNQVCPNPDNMTYEQLLELQEKIGYVDKGFKKEEVEKLPTIRFSKFRSTKSGNLIDRCTVCQFEFDDGEILRKLNCGHLYHKGCVDDWLLKDKKCPVCKIEVKI